MVKAYFKCDFDEESLDYYRFITHLKFFAQRLRLGQHYDDDNAELLEVVRFKYPKAYKCTQQICAFVKEKHQYDLGSEEMLYMTVHIARLVKHK